MKRHFALLLSVLSFFAVIQPSRLGAESASIAIPAPDRILARLKPGHPRLLATQEDFVRLQEDVKSSATLKAWHQDLRQQGEKILSASPSQYEIPDGKRLLATSRRVLDRVLTLGLLYKLEGDSRYQDRLWRELDTAAGFKDWNPSHFLDTAEMTYAFALAYDWLYHDWNGAERARLRLAILNLGLKPGVRSFRTQSGYGWWVKAHHNWNQVCNGGIGMGALAIADEEPALAGEFLHDALVSIQKAMVNFAPDGAWNEGPGYWAYATRYNVAFLAGLQTALGTDYGLGDIPGFAEAGMFPIYNTGPQGRTFNYADGSDRTIRAPQMFWLARRFNQPAYAWYQQRVASPGAMDLVWFNPAWEDLNDPALPLDRYFRDAEVVNLRSDWNDADALFVGFKAGDNKANHSNLDLGTFVLDALGKRWAVDLGADNYNLPGYFGGKRWTYYRMRTESHNTLLINPGEEPNQDPKAATRIERFEPGDDSAFAIADLTPAYAKQARQVKRGIARIHRNEVLIQDEINAKSPSNIWWFMSTPAEIEVNGNEALLTQGKDQLKARILSPSGASFSVMDARPLPRSPDPDLQRKNSGIQKLTIHLTENRTTTLAVQLTPVKDSQPRKESVVTIQPLADW